MGQLRSQRRNNIPWDNSKYNFLKSLGFSKSISKRELHSDTGLLQEKWKILIYTESEKEQMKPKVSRRKEIIKVRVEINEIEIEKAIEKTSETKVNL